MGQQVELDAVQAGGRGRLFPVIPKGLAGLGIDEMKLGARCAEHRLVGVVRVRAFRIVREPALHFKARYRASINNSCH